MGLKVWFEGLCARVFILEQFLLEGVVYIESIGHLMSFTGCDGVLWQVLIVSQAQFFFRVSVGPLVSLASPVENLVHRAVLKLIARGAGWNLVPMKI